MTDAEKLARYEAALRCIEDLAAGMANIDYNADANDTSPEDAVAHVAGLIWQECRATLTEVRGPRLGNADAAIAEIRAAGLKAWDAVLDPEGLIGEMREDDMPTVHQRKCHNCGFTHWHFDCIVPYVLCPDCGSQDTRKTKTE